MRPLRPDSLGGRHHVVERRVGDEERKPNLAGFWICIGDFVAVDDPGNDPECTSASSPAYQNGATYSVDPDHDFPAFRHGLTGRLQWKGILDLTGFSSGDVFTTLPTEWIPDFDEPWIIPVISPTPGMALLYVFGATSATPGDCTVTLL